MGVVTSWPSMINTMMLQNCLSQWASITASCIAMSHCCCIVSVASRVSQHMFTLLSSAKFLRKWGSVSDVMPSPGLGHHHYTQYTLQIIYFTLLLFLFCWLSSKALKLCKEFEECPMKIIIIHCRARLSECYWGSWGWCLARLPGHGTSHWHSLPCITWIWIKLMKWKSYGPLFGYNCV